MSGEGGFKHIQQWKQNPPPRTLVEMLARRMLTFPRHPKTGSADGRSAHSRLPAAIMAPLCVSVGAGRGSAETLTRNLFHRIPTTCGCAALRVSTSSAPELIRRHVVPPKPSHQLRQIICCSGRLKNSSTRDLCWVSNQAPAVK